MLGLSVTESKFMLDYEGTKNLDFTHFVTHTFSAGGYSWAVRCHPHGAESDDCNCVYLSLYLQLLDGSTPVQVIFQAFVMGKRGGWAGGKRFMRAIPPAGAWGFGFPHFMKQGDLESDVVTDGQASFMFVVTVLRDNPIYVPPSDMGDHLGVLLDCADGSDVSFSVGGGETFRAHRSVLAARSPVFRAQLLGSMADANLDCITLHDDMQPATFQALLRLRYTDALPGDLESSLLQSLLAAADMYHMERLKLVCSQKLCKRLSTDTVAEMIRFAETHNCPELKNACIDFFLVEKNFKKAVLTQGYMRLMQSSPSIIDEIGERMGN